MSLFSGDVLRRSKDLSIVKLRHPSSSQPALFIIGPKNDTFCEVLSFNESKRSWFIDENVKSDGRILISTPIDPLFLIIPYLKKVLQFYFIEKLIFLSIKIIFLFQHLFLPKHFKFQIYFRHDNFNYFRNV